MSWLLNLLLFLGADDDLSFLPLLVADPSGGGWRDFAMLNTCWFGEEAGNWCEWPLR